MNETYGAYQIDDKGNIIFPENEPEPATLNRRLIAFSIDSFIILFISNLLLPIVYFLMPPPGGGQLNYERLLSDQLTGRLTFADVINALSESGLLQFYLFNQILSIILMIGYFAACWYFFANTPGKMILNCEIVDAQTFKKPTHRQFIWRLFGYVLTGLTFGLGFMIAAFNRKKQTLHDYFATTIVIRKRGIQKNNIEL
jgi:uncharacterized RDD family membrane protein YckC